MKTIALQKLDLHPVGHTISWRFAYLSKGIYAFMPEASTGKTQVFKQTESAGTNFFKYFQTVGYPYHCIEETNLFPHASIELNASPAGSDCQEYADALVFEV